MLRDLVLGIMMNLAVMMVHVGTTVLLMMIHDHYQPNPAKRLPHAKHVLLMMGSVTLLLVAHLFEVGLWAMVYRLLGLVSNGPDAYYSAFMTYTTLGLGHAVELEHARLVEPLTAASGIMMFGWTTAILINVLQRGGKQR
ncbi:ion channel [Ancylobacter lacus]|uniref:ion channel n=1 Tax=Ancylobacter lacus TaxID=2579970 RepID=UPI001BD015D5|nr:ion channel [Ancylobacter lacus]MBS7540134.1 two pore domain potassium channel family protein [Ancylobacter lacus]